MFGPPHWEKKSVLIPTRRSNLRSCDAFLYFFFVMTDSLIPSRVLTLVIISSSSLHNLVVAP